MTRVLEIVWSEEYVTATESTSRPKIFLTVSRAGDSQLGSFHTLEEDSWEWLNKSCRLGNVKRKHEVNKMKNSSQRSGDVGWAPFLSSSWAQAS